MAYCTNCGNQIDDGAKFCPSCGQPVSTNSQTIEVTEAVQPSKVPEPTGKKKKEKKKRGCCGIILWILIIGVVLLVAATYFSNNKKTKTNYSSSKTTEKQTEKKEKQSEKQTEKQTEKANNDTINVDVNSVEVIKAVQTALNGKGFDCGTPDGIAGKKTKEAIASYKSQNGMDADESITPELLTSLGISEQNLSESKTENETPSTSAETQTEKKEEKVTGIRPEFKEAMDAYEAFFDEYVEIMELAAKDPSDLTVLAKTADYLIKYDENMKKMEALEDDAMSDEETAYYIEVTLRIEKKLLTVASTM